MPGRRGAQSLPANRFERIRVEADYQDSLVDDLSATRSGLVPTEYFADESKSIVSQNDSPDIGFDYSINPYRGCVHGCAYCYARNTHEFLGLSAGLDFESKIFVKEKAPELFCMWLDRDKWNPELIVFSGVTDCYQPVEKQLKLTRGCLEVAWEYRQPVSIITKNALVTRDIDILSQMAAHNLASVTISVNSLDAKLTSLMEPRTSTSASRLRAISQLAAAGIPAQVMVAPVIPSLNDCEVPAILEQAHLAGASAASYVLLRLPLTVREVFVDWLRKALPMKADRVLARMQVMRNGQLNSCRFGDRMRGQGELADQIKRIFEVFARRYGLDQTHAKLDTTQFRRPQNQCGSNGQSGQQLLFPL